MTHSKANKPATETHTHVIVYAFEHDTTERTFSTNVTIDADDPITDVADIANDRFYAKYPEAQVIDEYTR